MKIDVFTIRNKATNELIYAEGTSADNEYISHFSLDSKWLKEHEVGGAWYKNYANQYGFDEEVRHLMHGDYELVVFALEEVEFN